MLTMIVRAGGFRSLDIVRHDVEPSLAIDHVGEHAYAIPDSYRRGRHRP